MRLSFGCDEAACEMKRILMEHAAAQGHECVDCGVGAGEINDYPIYAARAAIHVQSGDCQRGIVVCGTGIGVSIVSNKLPGIRCAHLTDCYSAVMCRAHNDANMAAFGARVTGPELAKMMLDHFLNTPYEGGRHQRRVDAMRKLEAGEPIE